MDKLNAWIEDNVHPKLRIARITETGRTPRWAVYVRGERNPRIKRAQIQDAIAWVLFAKVFGFNPAKE